jgi:hypothetical protein
MAVSRASSGESGRSIYEDDDRAEGLRVILRKHDKHLQIKSALLAAPINASGQHHATF